MLPEVVKPEKRYWKLDLVVGFWLLLLGFIVGYYGIYRSIMPVLGNDYVLLGYSCTNMLFITVGVVLCGITWQITRGLPWRPWKQIGLAGIPLTFVAAGLFDQINLLIENL